VKFVNVQLVQSGQSAEPVTVIATVIVVAIVSAEIHVVIIVSLTAAVEQLLQMANS
jgi:hypothetical protein